MFFRSEGNMITDVDVEENDPTDMKRTCRMRQKTLLLPALPPAPLQHQLLGLSYFL